MSLLGLNNRIESTAIPNLIPFRKPDMASGENSMFQEIEQLSVEQYRPSLEIGGSTESLDFDFEEFYKLTDSNVVQFPTSTPANSHSEINVKEAIAIYKNAVMGFFSFVTLAMVILTSFLVLGITKTVSLPVSVFGSFVSLIMVFGVVIEYKKWESKYD